MRFSDIFIYLFLLHKYMLRFRSILFFLLRSLRCCRSSSMASYNEVLAEFVVLQWLSRARELFIADRFMVCNHFEIDLAQCAIA